MKVSARPLFRGAAGMKGCDAFGRRDAGQIQFFKCNRGDRWNLSPIVDLAGRLAAAKADFLISLIVGELQREQFERQGVERRIESGIVPDEREQSDGEI